MEEYKGITWEQAYPNERLRESIKFNSRFFRRQETEIREEREKKNHFLKTIPLNSSEY